MAKDRTKTIRVELSTVFSVLAFAVSALALYFSVLKVGDIELFVGPAFQVGIDRTSKVENVHIPFTLVNSGANGRTIDYAKLVVKADDKQGVYLSRFITINGRVDDYFKPIFIPPYSSTSVNVGFYSEAVPNKYLFSKVQTYSFHLELFENNEPLRLDGTSFKNTPHKYQIERVKKYLAYDAIRDEVLINN